MPVHGSETLKLYTDSYSQPCRAVEIFLLNNYIPYESLQINLLQGEQKSVSFSEVNPLQKIPVLDDNGFILKESSAILKYLCRRNEVADHWYPKDLKQCARVDEYLAWHHLGTRDKVYSYVRYKVSAPLAKGVLPNQKELKKLQVRMLDVLSCLEKLWLGDKKFICGEEISIADLIAATELEQLVLVREDVKAISHKLGDWISRVRIATEPHYENTHLKLYALSKKISNVIGVLDDPKL